MTRKPPENKADTPRNARLVVVGAGFAGGSLLSRLPSSLKRPGETLLVNYGAEHVFVPLIHEVAVGRLHPDNIRIPVQDPAFDLLQAEATGIDLDGKTLFTSAGPVRYRYLVLAPGSVATPPPEGLAEHFQTFWSLEDALTLRTSLNKTWQATLRGERRPGELTVAVVGGGATGVEVAAEAVALFDHLKQRSTRKPARVPRVVLLEATDRLMDWLGPYYHEVALEELTKLGVEVRLNAEATAADEGGIVVGGDRLPAAVRVWAAGVRANPLVRDLPGEHDSAGRVRVTENLTLPGYPDVYVLGDGSRYEHPRLGPLPPTASVAVQQGPYVARDLDRRLRSASRRPFDYFDRGYAVSLGPEGGVADPVGVRIRGRSAQALYRSVLLYYLKNRRGRLLTGADWTMERTLGRLGFDYGARPANGTGS